tara:strand:- start:910 stop:1551 length:642 start_codon:yes stop_codon:yes gene_type:complete
MNKHHKINTKYKNLRKVNRTPPMYVCDKFLTNNECNILKKEAKNKLYDSKIIEYIGGKIVYKKDNVRESKSCYLNNKNNINISGIIDKISKLVKKDKKYFENIQVGCYKKGGFYKSHYDSIDMNTEIGKKFVEEGGQRIITVLMYLNDIKKGGCTYFEEINKRFSPKKGSAIIFFPSYLNREVDTKALHCAEEVINKKWVSQLWIRDEIQNNT